MALTLLVPMAVLTPDSETSELHERAQALVRDGNSPDQVCERLPSHSGAESDAALWLYSWALAQQRDERPLPRPALPAAAE
jgi:hypothetical protein